MKNIITTSLALFTFISTTSATYETLKWKYPETERTLMACKYAVTHAAVFCKADTAKSYKCQCSNEAALGTIMNCIYEETFVNNTEIEEIFHEYCKELKIELSPEEMRSQYENATKYMISTDDIADFNKSIPISTPIFYHQKDFNKSFDSLQVRWANISDSIYFGAALLEYWAFILFVAAVYNFSSKISVVGRFFNQKPFIKLRQYISMPSLFANKKHNEAVSLFGPKLSFFSGLLPTRIESIILFIWFSLNVIFESVRYHYVMNGTIWKTKEAQISRYAGDRSGILCLYGFLLTFLFVGRNNFLLWLTGWKQSTFITYHKWISRINLLMLLVHAVTMHINSVSIGKLQVRLLVYWYRWGIIAVVAGFLMWFQGLHWFRKTSYETFLLFHIILAAIFLAATWIHVSDFGYQNWAFAITGVWCFDRLVRIIRLFLFGVKTATATIVSNETIKIRIPKRHFWKTYPGAFGYVHFLKPTTFFQSHPFTIVSDDHDEIVFYVRIKGGVTSYIHRFLAEKPNQTGEIKVSVEGPYGDPKPLKRYDTSLLYAGGNGIPGLYAYAKQLSTKSEKQVKLYWVIRNWHSIDWFYEELVSLKDTTVKTIIYITLPTSSIGSKFEQIIASSNSDTETSSKEENDEKSQTTHEQVMNHLDFIEFRFSRPNIEELVKTDLEESSGNVAVMTCAHNSMTDHLRYAVSENLDTAQGRVDYFEELQSW